MKTINKNIDYKKSLPYVVKSMGAPSIKDVDLSKKIVTGYYNMYNFLDSDMDVIFDGAAKKSISERGPGSNAIAKIKHLLFHDWKQLPGKVITLEERSDRINNQNVKGIYFETKMSDTQMGIDTLINYQQEIYDNHSIGFMYMEGEWLDREAEEWDEYISKLINPEAAEGLDYAWFWKEIMLYEGSTVAFGANSLTPYLGVKNENKDALFLKVMDRFNRLNSALKSGTQSDEMMQTFEMETLQLKQIITELFNNEPSIKATLPIKGRQNKDTIMTCSGCGNDFNYGDMQPNTSGEYACPDCNVLCMPGTKSGINFSQLIKMF